MKFNFGKGLQDFPLLKNHCALAAPTAEKYFRVLTPEYEVFIILSIIFCLAIIVIFISKAFLIFHYVSSHKRAGLMLWLAAIFPITAIVSTVTIAIPRAMAISNMFIFLYFARSLFTFVELVIDYFGGRTEMARELAGNKVKMNIPPCCCCFPCLPTMKPSPQNLRRLAVYVYQTALINPAIYFVMAVVWTDQIGVTDKSGKSVLVWFLPLLSALSFISTMTAMYGISLYARMSDGALIGYRLRAQVRFMQIMLLCYNFQSYIFNIVTSTFGLIHCDEILPATAKASMYDRFALIIESLILSLASSILFRPSVNATFDLHPARAKFRERKPAFSFSDPRPLRRMRGSSFAETISDALAFQQNISSYYYCADPELADIQEQQKVKGPDHPVRKRSISSSSAGYIPRKVTPMPMSSASSPGIPSGMRADTDGMKKPKMSRHRIPDSIQETDEEMGESDREEEKGRRRRRPVSGSLDDDVFVETEEEEEKPAQRNGKANAVELNVEKLHKFFENI